MILHTRIKKHLNDMERLKRTIPTTSKKEVFTLKEEDGNIVFGNGSYNVNAPVETSHNPQIMKEYISGIIELSIREAVNSSITLPNYIVSNRDENGEYKGIIVWKCEYIQLYKNNF